MKKFLSLMALICCMSVGLRAESGTCGANLSWEYANGTLTITGSGPMTNFNGAGSQPWVSIRASIVQLVLPEDLTVIGDYAFANCSKLRMVTIPSQVTRIGSEAFRECPALSRVTFAEGSKMQTIGVGAFRSCTALASMQLPEGLVYIENGAFNNCSKLSAIDIPASVLSVGNLHSSIVTI